jgi:pullulanase/glycogen debranching enzyme
VVHEAYDWGLDAPPRVAPGDTILYELHVKGFTRLHPDVPPALQGSYAAMAHPAVLDYLAQLGITTVSLMPVHFRADEMRLQQIGLSNYWGYSSIGFFAPETRYWSGQAGSTPISEFRDMVKALHGRGIEVVLDVVYNHTAETDEFGPTLSFRGIDNELYYHLRPNNPALVRKLDRLRQLPEPGRAARAATGDGFAALLGAGDARRRLPLRPGARTGAHRAPAFPAARPSWRPCARTRCWRR